MEEKEIYLDPARDIEERVEDLLKRMTLDEKINEANIIIEEDEYVDTELPENYHADFKNLFTEDDENTDDPLISEIELRSYSLYHEDEDDFEPELKGKAKNSDDDENQPKRISKLHIATIIVTVILLLSIIVFKKQCTYFAFYVIIIIQKRKGDNKYGIRKYSRFKN